MQDLINFLSQHQGLTLALIIVATLLVIVELIRLKKRTYLVTPQQATQLINHQHGIIFDIRQPDLFKKGHVIDAQSIPVKDLQSNNKKLERYKNKPIIVVCQNGSESQKVAAQLLKQGYNAHALTGGIRAWLDAQLPLVKE